MKRAELVQFLLDNKGYLKKGSQYLAEKFNIEESVAKETLKSIKQSKKPKYVDFDEPVKKFNNQITKPGTYWVTGCAHVPWHNKQMYDSTIKFIQLETNLSGIILAGDIIDANSLSAHDRGNIALPGVTLEWEYKEGQKFLDQISEAIPKDIKLSDNFDLFYLYGNHEDRYSRLIKNVDSSKYGKALKSPTEGLKLIERGYKVFTSWKDDSIKIGKHLDVNHGEFCNIHTAKKTIDTYRQSTMYFHTHRYQIHIEGQVGGFNMGAGADFTAPIFGYATRAMKTSWSNCSALVTLDNEGFYHVQPLHFINNKLVVNGKQY